MRLVREGKAITRAELVEQTGLARSTVSARIDRLIEHGLLVTAGEHSSTGGRRPVTLALNPDFGVVLSGELGATRSHLAVTDLHANVLVELTEDIAVAAGPAIVLEWLEHRFAGLLAKVGRERSEVRGVGIGLPGPVEFATGRPIRPPIMPGWSGVPVADLLADRLGAKVLVDNDVNVMAIGEHRIAWRGTDNLLFVKVGTGIGCGIIARGSIYRGAAGAAGDLGHIRAAGEREEVCGCGNRGCLEAIAGGSALVETLRRQGVSARDVHDVAARIQEGDPIAVASTRQAGRDIGEVLASIVSFFNPSVVVFGGELADAGEDLMAGVREVVYRRSLPLATDQLIMAHTASPMGAGVVGAAVMALEPFLEPSAVNRRLGGSAG